MTSDQFLASSSSTDDLPLNASSFFVDDQASSSDTIDAALRSAGVEITQITQEVFEPAEVDLPLSAEGAPMQE